MTTSKGNSVILAITGAALACLAIANSADAAILAVDFGASDKPVETGFTGQSSTSDTHSTTAGDLTVDISGIQGLFDYTTNTGTTHQDLFRDFYFKNNGSMTLTLSGPAISANTEYDFTFWSLYGLEARNTTISGTAGTTGASLGPIAYTVNPSSLSDNAASGKFTSDSSGVLTFTLGSTNNRPAINGFEISAVPEPSTFILATLSLLGLIGGRRRRK
jgi:hypothetical protein